MRSDSFASAFHVGLLALRPFVWFAALCSFRVSTLDASLLDVHFVRSSRHSFVLSFIRFTLTSLDASFLRL